MRLRTRLVAALALSVVAVGVAAWLVPPVAVAAGLVDLLTAVGNAYPVFLAIGVLALILAFTLGMTALLSGDRAASMPIVEEFTSTDTPGDEFELAMADLAGRRGRAARPESHRERIERRLRDDAVRTVARIESCSSAAARERVASGEWTDDRYAAGFVGDDVAGPRWWQRLRDRLLRVDGFERSARRTAKAVADLAASAERSTGGGAS
jgi:hypothetical protein